MASATPRTHMFLRGRKAYLSILVTSGHFTARPSMVTGLDRTFDMYSDLDIADAALIS